MILHICSSDSWKAALNSGSYIGDTLLSEGFIHCSAKDQVIEVADYIFRGRAGLLLLLIDEAKVKEEIKYEDAGNGNLYPHIYGHLNLDAVIGVVEFPPQADGTFVLPSSV
jgi:uncharacterized protein (DUF952 family)